MLTEFVPSILDWNKFYIWHLLAILFYKLRVFTIPNRLINYILSYLGHLAVEFSLRHRLRRRNLERSFQIVTSTNKLYKEKKKNVKQDNLKRTIDMVLTWLAEGDALAGGTKANNTQAPTIPQGLLLPTSNPNLGNPHSNGEYFYHL